MTLLSTECRRQDTVHRGKVTWSTTIKASAVLIVRYGSSGELSVLMTTT